MRFYILAAVVAVVFAAVGHPLCTPSVARAGLLLSEDFEGLPLGPNVDEVEVGDTVWTKTAPAGWTIDDSGVPGAGDPDNDGVTEWAGWSFADRAWWAVAGGQGRSAFQKGQGTVAIVDPDEWDDLQPHPDGTYNSFLETPAISLTGVAESTVRVLFDSSWRPEPDQKALLTVSYDGGPEVDVFRWISEASDPNFKAAAEDESVSFELDNPAGANEMVLKFGMIDAGNNWWWAIDNVQVFDVQSGDVNGDGVSDILDFEVIRDHFFMTGATLTDGDLDLNGVVNFVDFRLWKEAAFLGGGAPSNVPEPTTLFLLAGGLVMALATYRRN